MKKVMIFFFMIMLVNVYGVTEWDFHGINGNGSLTILYKTLPPLVVEVDEPEIMRIKRGTSKFKYSNSTKSQKPLNVNIEIQFNDGIIDQNGINKDIVQAIYDTVNLKLLGNGKIELRAMNETIWPRIDGTGVINGIVYFSNISGDKENNGESITRKLGESIKGGLLTSNDIYIDAEFNQEEKEILAGTYLGKITLEVEFIGKETLWQ